MSSLSPGATDADHGAIATTPRRAAAPGMLLGLIGVLIFSATLPMTRLAVVDLHPVFIAFGRAAIAGAAAVLLLACRRPVWPTSRQWRLLLEQ